MDMGCTIEVSLIIAIRWQQLKHRALYNHVCLQARARKNFLCDRTTVPHQTSRTARATGEQTVTGRGLGAMVVRASWSFAAPFSVLCAWGGTVRLRGGSVIRQGRKWRTTLLVIRFPPSVVAHEPSVSSPSRPLALAAAHRPGATDPSQ